jgi:hypothetical protein
VRRWASWAGAPPLRCDQHAAASLGLKRHGRSRVVHIAAEWAAQEQCAIAYDSAGASPRLSSLQRGEKAQQAINRLRGRLADIGPERAAVLVAPYRASFGAAAFSTADQGRFEISRKSLGREGLGFVMVETPTVHDVFQ